MTEPSLLPSLRVSRRFSASAEQVFVAWLDPQLAGRFLFATPGGTMVRVEIDPHVGGGFVIVERRSEGDAEHLGEYLEIDRPRRLTFAFQRESVVSLEIVPHEGGCELTLVHDIQPQWEPSRDKIAAGWSGILEGLAKVLDTFTASAQDGAQRTDKTTE